MILDYRFAVLTATALALARRHDAGQADGSETGQARPFIEYCAAVAGTADVAAIAGTAIVAGAAAMALVVPPSGQEPPQWDRSHTELGADCASRA
jgi:hypothetical protein